MKKSVATIVATLLLVLTFGVMGAAPTRAVGTGDFVQPATSPEPLGATAPLGIAAGDINGDLVQDLAVTSTGFDSVAVLLGSVSGDYTPAPTSPEATGSSPMGVVMGDFNLDGSQDIATANNDGDDVTILLGDGAGNFSPAATSPEGVGSDPKSLVIGRFNADAFDDLAVSNQGSDNVTVLLGDGTGDFTPAATSPETVGDSPEWIAVGDFDENGAVDLVTSNRGSQTVTILLGDGAGGFTEAPSSPETVVSPVQIAVGRFNSDGHDDLAVTVASSVAHEVAILLGDGTGDFAPAPTSPETAPAGPFAIATGLFNGDAFADLAVANPDFDNVTILFGDGTGNFTEPTTSPEPTGDRPLAIAAGLFNADGDGDLAVANANSDDVTILLNVPVADDSPAPPAPPAPPPPPPPAPPADPTPPDTTITSEPLTKTKKRIVTFTFVSSESNSVFECSIDGSDFQACSTPFATPKLKRGRAHVFAVRAIDQVGNIDPTPASDDFKVKKRKNAH